jgi:alkane 1-monooxygenase
MPLFAAATLLPLPLLAAAALWGGPWIIAALLWLTVLTFALDSWLRALPSPREGAEFPGSDALLVALTLGGLGLAALAVWALARDGLGPWAKAGLLWAASIWLGQVGNAAAHELIHRDARALRRLGTMHFAAMLFGHHASAHPLVHHVHVATRADPSTARLGEPFWRFAGRAWRGSLRKGFRAEAERLARAGRPGWRHPYFGYAAATAAAGAAAWGLGGWLGVGAWALLGVLVAGQLLLSDYVQHYGLLRAVRADGRPEPVGPRHSWNSPHAASSALMLNAPRHSDHHAHPSRPYPALLLPPEAEAPQLPWSLPVMACLAMAPSIWRRVMDARARAWAPLAQG